MKHPLRCRCGTLKGHVSRPDKATRLVCYCKDCQAFAHFLGRPQDILDGMGGTDVAATRAEFISFTEGADNLACMSLSDKGLLRWYARCCNTPIGNTPRDHKLPHVGLIHTCLANPSQTLDSSFGPVRMHTGSKSAQGKPPSMPLSGAVALLRIFASLIPARLNGSYRHTPFFDERGTPVVTPKVLTRAERERVTSAA